MVCSLSANQQEFFLMSLSNPFRHIATIANQSLCHRMCIQILLISKMFSIQLVPAPYSKFDLIKNPKMQIIFYKPLLSPDTDIEDVQ